MLDIYIISLGARSPTIAIACLSDAEAVAVRVVDSDGEAA